MSALTANRNTKERQARLRRYPVLDEEIMYAGGLAAIDSNGEVQMASDTAGLIVTGVSTEYVDNTGDGEYCTVKTGCFLFANSSGNPITNAHVGRTCWIEDDNTVSSSPGTNGIEAGKVFEVDTDGVWVEVGADVNAVPVASAANALDDQSGGSASGTQQLAAVGATNSADVSAAINNNFATVAAEYNAVVAALKAAGLMASS